MTVFEFILLIFAIVFAIFNIDMNDLIPDEYFVKPDSYWKRKRNRNVIRWVAWFLFIFFGLFFELVFNFMTK